MKHFFREKLLPAVTLSDPESACRLAEALLEGGVTVLEVTFRTEAAIESLQKITEEFPELLVGAGTITDPGQIPQAVDAGAKFGLSPGLNAKVVETAVDHQFPFIPGVMTPSEIEKGLDLGCNALKLFPAKNLGGAAFVGSLEGPYAHMGVQFIPMGGVNTRNMKEYLEFESVIAVGGSWLAPAESIRKQDYREITRIVRKSVETAGAL